MSLPEPQPGLVIRYSYLWSSEQRTGSEESAKDRPCAIVLVVQDLDDTKKVAVVPVTHRRSESDNDAVEIPAVTRERLALDTDMSWIVVSEVNIFVWPGPDLRPLPGVEPVRFEYGFLPPRLFAVVKERLAAKIRAHLARQVPRSR